MIPHYGGKVGEYMWQKEMERLERFKDRPWELQSRQAAENPLLVLFLISIATVAGVMVLSLF